ncbi:hypothetical protein ASZ90_008996 [hydrocarbon metagenome]|uniref:Uncharacterized protein n=1 Tax=hydrocarbon metagenome TaxID=938273 RepID=A0A0W8FK28_9ZZZZ
MFRLPKKHRDCFRRPFGDLYPGIGDLLPAIAGRAVYTVGDVVTHNLFKAGVVPSVAIIDGYTMRAPCDRTPLLRMRRLFARNPPGTLTRELIEAIADAVTDPPAVIFVDGEEDLAVIPLVLAAPMGAAILYGQPEEGVVLRLVDDEAKRVAASFLDLFVEA